MISIKIEEARDVFIIHLNGKFILENIKQVNDTWHELVSANPNVIALNCSKLEQIDSSAIGVLVKYLNEAMGKNIKLTFFDLKPPLIHLFSKAKLLNYFSITSQEEFENTYLLKEQVSR